MPIFTVEDVRRYRLEATVNESDLRYVRIGQSESRSAIDALGERRTLKGKVVQIVPAADPASRSFLVKIELPADSRLRSGLFGRAQFSRGERQSLVDSASSRSSSVANCRAFMCWIQNQVASLRYITLGKTGWDRKWKCSRGLQTGERLVPARRA